MTGGVASNALILGADGAVGAYLARLLQARGSTVFGTIENGSGGLRAIGAAEAINVVLASEAIGFAATRADATVFAINDGGAEQAALVAAVLTDAARARLVHVVDADALRRTPRLQAQANAVATLRCEGGRHAVNAILHSHDSRLGGADTLPAIVIDAAFRAARGERPALKISETGPRDWGWTPEYVDAVARAATLAVPADLAIGSGHTLDVAEFVAHAFEYFRIDPSGHVHVLPGAADPELAVDTAQLKAATGWSASTWGRDLVRALCEGASARADGPGAVIVPVR